MLVAFVPLTWALFSADLEHLSVSDVVGPLYLCYFTYHGVCNWWISSWQRDTDPYLFVSGLAVWLAHPFLLMLPWLALVALYRKYSPLVVWSLIPFVATAAEWVHGQTDFSYPWLSVGYSAVELPMVHLAQIVGVYGVSFLIMCVNALVFAALRQRARGLHWFSPALAALLLPLLSSVWGLVLADSSDVGAHTSDIKVAIVQPNIDPWDKWSAPSEQLQIHKQVTDSLTTRQPTIELVVWSETAIPYVIRNYRYLYDWLQLRNWVDTGSFSLLTGFADMMVYPAGEAPSSARSLAASPMTKYDHFNAAMMLNPHDPDVPVHRKTMLTPFAERLPFADQLSFAMKWFEWGVGISAWGKGQLRTPLPVMRGRDTIARLGTIICIESIYPDVARDLVNNGADVLAVITNDAWYNGTWGPRQHYDIARMRAIEMRRPVIRCANSGVSGIIEADGTSTMELPELQRIAAVGTVRPLTGLTPYARFGDWLPKISLVITLFAMVVARFSSLLRILPASIVRQSSHNPLDA